VVADTVMRDLVIVMGVSLLAVFVLQRWKLPPLVGFLIAGVVIGPGGFGLVSDRESVTALANIGVVFLLFTVGLKFSI